MSGTWHPYNDKLIDDMVAAPATGDEVGKDSHYDHCRNPYERAAGKRKG
jgi:hypothetical protein